MTINLKINLLLALSVCWMVSCKAPQELLNTGQVKNVATHYGTEDFVLDSTQGNYRLLVSCDERRELITEGEIWEVDLESEKSRKLEIRFNSEHIAFHPHGISQFEDYLFVINHITDKEDEVIKFKVYKDSLVQVSAYREGFIGWGNDIHAEGVDEFYYTNFKIFGGSIIHYHSGEFEKLKGRLRLPNGIIVVDDEMYVSEIIGNRLIQFDLVTGKRQKLAHIKGGDNIMMADGLLYITAHSKYRKFMKHYKSSDNPSPSVVYSYDLSLGELLQIYNEKGEVISATATALVWNDQLYLSQVFENFISIFPIKEK